MPMLLDPSEVRSARENRGWSQGQLARKSGVHTVMISRLETGKSGANADTLRKLTDALGIVVAVPK